jgi:hypothetical protein
VVGGPGAPPVGYQTVVTRVRLGAPGYVPLAAVGRERSTKVSVRTPMA